MRFNASIDRIEDGIATLLPTNNERSPITMPQGLLPRGAREGQILSFTIEIDEAATSDAKRRVEWLLGELQKKSQKKR